MKDAKLILKEARTAIKNKNYETSLKLCKQLLRDEPDNYMALVFLGVSFQESGQHDKAYNALKKAVGIDSTNSLAWTGLANHLEKNGTEDTKHELVQAYLSLLKTETAEKKLLEYASKLRDLHEHGDITEIVSAIYGLFKSEKCTQLPEIATFVVNILSKEKSISSDLSPMYEDCLVFLLNNSKTVCIEFYSNYLTHLYNNNDKEKALVYARKMHEMFESDLISLKWICKIFNEFYIESAQLVENSEKIEQFAERILKFETNSSIALLTQSILFMVKNDFWKAKELLEQIVGSSSGLVYGWILLLKCCVELSAFNEAVQSCNKLDSLLKSSSKIQHLANLINVAIMEVLSKSDDRESLEKSLEIYQRMEDELKTSCVHHIIRANIKLDNYKEAESLLSKLEAMSSSNDNLATLLKAQLFHRQKQYQKALDLLLSNDKIEMSEWWLEIGSLYWELEQYENSLKPFLKAVKFNNSNYKGYLFLGNYYKHVKDLDKAKRCYEKSFRLNKGSEAGCELSRIYRQLKDWDSNLNILQSVTKGSINKNNFWAWMQLGLHYLAQRDYDKAITNLRVVIRVDQDNMNCWESLADAYLAKGAYTSALKCYEKVSSANSNSLYPILQMAKIKQILGEFVESRLDFEQILTFNSSYIPALKGIAETCLFQAKDCLKSHRLGTARDHAQSASVYLITALEQRKDLSCLWKLLGDCCRLVANLPPKYCFLNLPNFLMEKHDNKLEKIDLFVLSTKCYYNSVYLVDNNFLIWHDLAVSFLQYSFYVENKSLSQQLLKKAQKIAQHCAANDSSNWIHWNLLGNIEFSLEPPNFSLAQHFFIKAILADNNSAVSWSNLGTLYFILDEFKLANEAYSQAQRADPNYVNSWIGQAFIAESLSHSEAMDLFRHSTQLAFHPQGALGYAHWVCKTLKESPIDDHIYSIHNMNAIPVACDVLTWYTEENDSDGIAWNLLGFLEERMNLLSPALKKYKNSLQLLTNKFQEQDLVRVNYGRTLTRLHNYQEAIDVFTKIKVASFNGNCGLALALFKEQCYKESYEAYESTLQWLSDNPKSQSDLLVALSTMAYMFDGPEAAKTLLFQSLQLEEPSIWGFYSTIALGLLHRDFDLVNLILKELETTKNKKDCAYHFALFSSYFYLLQKQLTTAIRQIVKMLHIYPDQANLWSKLSSILLLVPSKKVLANMTAKCAQIVTTLKQNDSSVKEMLMLVVLSSIASGDVQNALSVIQKTIHYYPSMSEGWTLLVATLMKTKRVSRNYQKNILNFAETISSENNLLDWIRKQKVLFS